MITVLARTQAAEIDWIGSSLGGLTGIYVAALAGSPIRRMVVNDIGPLVPWNALARLGAYLHSCRSRSRTSMRPKPTSGRSSPRSARSATPNGSI